MYLAYTLLVTLLLPFALLRLLIRSLKAPDYRKRWVERFGRPPFKKTDCIWIHTVSLGEAIAATPYINALIKIYGSERLLITTITPTGSHYVQKKFPDAAHCYLPYDHPLILRRFFKSIHAKVLVLFETELWPNLLRLSNQQGIATLLLNARLSERSCKKYARFGRATKKMMSHLTLVAAQTQADASRLILIGAHAQNTQVTGNIKYDLTIDSTLQERAQTLKSTWAEKFIWIAGSTHEGEESQILKAHKMICNTLPNALLIIVPRHPERFDAVYNMIQDEGFSVVRRGQNLPCTETTEVYLGDTMGEMMLLYAASDIAFVGGSLIERGGHNLLEPASLGKPCLSGPHTFNFTQVSSALSEAQAMRRVYDAETLAQAVIHLYKTPKESEKMGQAGQAVLNQNKGALKKMIALTKQYI